MSSYTSPSDVQKYYMGYDVTKSDYITSADVRKWITEASTTIDMSLRRKYTLPITNANDLVFLKTLAEKVVVGKCDDIMRVDMRMDDEEKRFLRTRNYSKEARDLLAALVNGTLQLETSAKSLSPILYQRGRDS